MKTILLVSAAALVVASPALAKMHHHMMMHHGAMHGMKWMDASPAGLPAGAQMAVVKGDPTKAQDFIVQIKMPANYTVPPHHHPNDEVVRVVAGGPLAYGMGDKIDKSNAGSLQKGYHITMQSGMNHWVIAPAGGATVQVSAMGPFAIVYANAGDDPRKK